MGSRTVRVKFLPYGAVAEVPAGTDVLEAARSAGVGLRSICGGRGSCGKCRVVVEEGEYEFEYDPSEGLLTEEELERKYVLACRCKCLSDCTIFVPPETRLEGQRLQMDAVLPRVSPSPAVRKIYAPPERILDSLRELERSAEVPAEIWERAKSPSLSERGGTLVLYRERRESAVLDLEEGDTRGRGYGLAVDVGTTKIVAYLVDLESGEILGKESDLNGQLPYGEDVISRVYYAVEKKGGLEELQRAAVSTINSLIERLCARLGIEEREIYDVCVAGNTVMTYLFAGAEPSPLLDVGGQVRKEPFLLRAGSIGMRVNPNARVYCLPCVSRFLGGDAIGDVLLSGMYDSTEISLMVDIGTNVEVVLGSQGWLLATTAAAGPAFEGWGVRHGLRSVEGAIDHVEIDPDTLKAKYTVIGGVKPRGICGTGLIDLVSEMFRLGIIDGLGKINKTLKSPYVRPGPEGYEYVVVPKEESGIGRDIVITEKDIANIIDSKSAVCAAVAVLLKKMRLSVEDVKRVYVCGAFGSYLDLNNAIAIGMLPEFPKAEIVYLGNGSVAGAYLTLVSVENRRKAEEIAEVTAYFELLKDADFMDEYMAGFVLPGKRELFPTWWEASRKLRMEAARRRSSG